MSLNLSRILQALERILELEKQIQTAVESEKDASRRARLLKACQERDLDAVREMLYAAE